MKILAIGPLWRGSNAGGLFRALSRKGCLIEVVDEFYFISLQTKTKLTKVFERVIRPLQEEEFNTAIKKKIEVFKPDIFFVYKGAFVVPETLLFARKNNCKLVLFYPDVSMTAHGTNIPRSIPLYDLVFTTKTFGIKDMASVFGMKNTFFIPHGFDPEIHRVLEISDAERQIYGCDVSFIGTWSAKKEKWLAHLKEKLPQINLKIWGEQWYKASTPALKSSIQGKAILGDLYALAIQCSTINLGILSEQVSGSSSGDLITSRTFHIPGASGFLLHERNEESVLYYVEDEEAAFFDGPEELVIKVNEFLTNPGKREKIRLAGYKRAQKEHSLDARAEVIINQFKQNTMASNKRFSVQILFYDCDQFILKAIENCAPFVEKIYITYSPEPWNAYNKSAREHYKNPSNPEILKQSKYYSKIELITGVWEKEEDQRNECLDRARKDGFDYMIIQDADEFYNPSEYQKNLDGIIANPDHHFYRCRWYLFWKSMKYVIMNWYPYFYGNKKYAPSYKLTEINFNPCFAVNCKKDVRFKDRRMLNTTDFLMLDGICFHLSYVLNDAQVEGKLHTWGHSHQVDIKTWLSTKWYGWTPNTTNINPIGLINWPKAVEYKGEIPKELIGFSAGEQKYIKPEFKDWLNSKKKEWPAYFIVIMKDAKYLLRKMLKK